MPYERDDEPVKIPGKVRPARRTTSSRIKIYCLLCGGAAILAGHIALIGVMAEGLSEQVIRNISLTVAVFAILALPVGVLAIAFGGFIEQRSSNSIIQAIARIFSDLIVGPLAIFLLLLLWGSGNALFQLSLGQFLLGEEEIQYRHLMILSAYGGTLFGIYAAWQGRSSHGLGWLTSVLHGARVFAEAAFLAYAGLWLFRDAFGYALAQGKMENWEVMAIAILGSALIFAGSISLMGRQTQIRPKVTKKVDRVFIFTRIQQGIRDLTRVFSTTKSEIGRFIGTVLKKPQHIRTTVQPGGRVEFVSPELEEGQKVDVVVRPIK